MRVLIKGYVLGVLASKDCERLIRIAAVRGLKTVSLMQKRQLTEVVSEIDPTVLLICGQLWFVEFIDFGVWRDLPASEFAICRFCTLLLLLNILMKIRNIF